MKQREYYGWVAKNPSKLFGIITDRYTTMAGFCRDADISKGMLTNLLYSKRKATTPTVNKICSTLNMKKHDIFLLTKSSKENIKKIVKS